MREDIPYRCETIREFNENKRTFLLKDCFLESMTTMALTTIMDYENRIEGIIMSHMERYKKIEEIQQKMINSSDIKTRIERVMVEIGAERLEDLGMFSDTILRLLTEGETK